MDSKKTKDINKEFRVESPKKLVWKRLKKNKLAIAGLIILIMLIFVAIFGPIIAKITVGYNMETIDLENIGATPSIEHLLGTDEVGRDILTRLMYAGRISLSVGLIAVLIQVVIGSVLGAVSGYYGGIVDGIIMRIVDIFMCFPFLPILILLGTVMSDMGIKPQYRMFGVMFMIGIMSWPGLCRLIRGEILSLREQEFMQAAEATGLSDRRKIFKHLLPNTFADIIVTSTLSIAGAILTESSLSYLGLGVTPPTPSWGTMIQKVNDFYILTNEPWVWVPPGLCIFLTVMAINLFGDGLRDALDPKLKR